MSIEHELSRIADLLALLIDQLGGGATQAALSERTSTLPVDLPNKPERQTKGKKAQDQAKPEPTKEVERGKEPEADEPKAKLPEVEHPPYDKVREQIFALAEEKGRSLVVTTLKEFGVEKGQDLKPYQYAGVIAAIRAVREA